MKKAAPAGHMLGGRCRKNASRPEKCFFWRQECLAENEWPYNPFKEKEKKVGLVSKPHILLSQMVLLSQHLVADSYWVEFLEDPCFKKKWLIWGKTIVSCFFSGIMICGSCGLLHMEIWLFNLLSYFQQTRLVLFSIGHFWEEGRVPFKWHT